MPPPVQGLEVKSEVDGAWYEARVKPTGRDVVLLEVSFVGFDGDDEYLVGPDDVANRARFQSEQLQDEDCTRVNQGDVVCCLDKGRDFWKYFDADLVKVPPPPSTPPTNSLDLLKIDPQTRTCHRSWESSYAAPTFEWFRFRTSL